MVIACACNVEKVDTAQLLEESVSIIHRAIRAFKPPKNEPTYEWEYCPMRKKCKQIQPIVGVAARRGPGYA